MKVFITLFSLFSLFTATCWGQLPKPSTPTTEEEYNYISRGYQTQVSQGLDMKKGYHLKDLANIHQGNYEFTFKMLIRETTGDVAGIMAITRSLIWNKTYYMCIPHGNQDLLNRYWAQLNTWDKSISVAYGQVMSAMFGALAVKDYSLEKNKN